MGVICVTITAPDTTSALDEGISAARGGAGMVEYRLDAIARRRLELDRLIGESPLPAIVTFRLPADGGLDVHGSIPEADRIGLLVRSLELGARYVDIEHGREAALAEKARGRLVVSHHDFSATPEDLPEIARRIEAGPADVVKLATMARSSADAFRHYEVIRETRKPAIAFTMGEVASASRIVALKLGSPWTYAAPDSGGPAAPGQLPLGRMVNDFRADRITEKTDLYGVIGHPIGHSMSPAMHNAALAAEGLDAVYLAFDVEASPADWVRAMFGFGMSGVSVTIPHKTEVMAALDDIDPAAHQIGAVNTVYRREGRLIGTNTDLDGALDPIARAAGGRERLGGKAALVIGAGGAARALVFGLAGAGAVVTLTDIDAERASKLARDSGSTATGPDEIDPGSFDIVANASPVGMHPCEDACPLDTSRLRPDAIVFDAVYNPLQTRLIREAAERGCVTVSGVEMFVGQGARQFELFTGRKAPLQVMRSAVMERLR